MYCHKCGAEIDDEAVICPKCGVSVGRKTYVDPYDESSVGWAVLAFFLPVVGLILYLLWHKEKPLRSKSIGKGALIGVGVSVLIEVVAAIIIGSVYGALIGGMMALASI